MDNEKIYSLFLETYQGNGDRYTYDKYQAVVAEQGGLRVERP